MNRYFNLVLIFIFIFNSVEGRKIKLKGKESSNDNSISTFGDRNFESELEIFENSNNKNHLKILRAHPDLTVKEKLTKDSQNEQANASLNECSDKEFKEFKKLNKKYKKKFGFPFIIAVKGKNKNEILNKFKKRVLNNIDIEFKEAKKQVKKIATFRLNEIKK